MSQPTYGPHVQKWVKELFAVLLDFVYEDDDVDWRTKNQVVVKTRLEVLRHLAEKYGVKPSRGKGKISNDNVRDAPKDYLKDFLGILQYGGKPPDTSGDWCFRLKLWHEDREENLKRFDEEWEQRKQERDRQKNTKKPRSKEPADKRSPLNQIQYDQIPNNIPLSGVVEFVGTDTELQALHQQLQQFSKVAICAVAGMGGVGKTELAVQYARRYLHNYRGGICWITTRSVDVGTQIVTFCESRLNLTPPDWLELANPVAFCWQNWPEGEVLAPIPWLWVLSEEQVEDDEAARGELVRWHLLQRIGDGTYKLDQLIRQFFRENPHQYKFASLCC